KFAEAYLACWHELLNQNDVRANFVDGNILEPELSPNGQVMVRKAAHLIPELVRKGLISESMLTNIVTRSSDETLKASIEDGISFLHAPKRTTKSATDEAMNQPGSPIEWLHKFSSEISYELKKVRMRAALDGDRHMPPARVAWERKDHEAAIVRDFGERLGNM